MNEEDTLEMIAEAIFADDNFENVDVRTFEDAAVMCGNKGLVLKFDDGSKFQLQLIQVN